jgi:hypothetical protein
MFENRIALGVILCFALFVGANIPNILAGEEPAITWQTYNDRNNLFTVQHPSNWTPSGVAEAERYGPIDILFSAPAASEDQFGEIEFVQYAEPSAFSTAQESLQSEISSLQNDPTITKFEIERPVECQSYTLAGLPACSYIYEIVTEEGSWAVLAVDAVASNGTEYESYYRATFDLFQNLLPAAENMIKSFQLTGDGSAATDFSLEGGSSSSNATATTNSSLTNEDFSLNDTTTTTTNTTGANSSNNDNFSLN